MGGSGDTTVDVGLKAFFKMDETSGSSIIESVSGNIYTPETGGLGFTKPNAVTLQDTLQNVDDFPQTTKINFDRRGCVTIAAGVAIASGTQMRNTIGKVADQGSLGAGTFTSLHFAIRGSAGLGIGIAGYPSVPVSWSTDDPVIIIGYFVPGDFAKCWALDSSGATLFSNTSTAVIPEDIGVIVIKPSGRMSGLHFYGNAFWSVSAEPSDLLGASGVGKQCFDKWSTGDKTIPTDTLLWV